MTNKVRGSVIDLPLISSTKPIATTYPAGTVAFNSNDTSPTGWKYTGTEWVEFGEKKLSLSVSWSPPAIAPLATGGGSSGPFKTVNSQSIEGTGDIAVQPVLVSGTSIKTINSTSILGSGDITVSGSLPTQTGQSGKFLTTDGLEPSWASVAGGGVIGGQLAPAYSSGTTYKPGAIIWDSAASALKVANKTTTGAFVSADWTTLSVYPLQSDIPSGTSRGIYAKLAESVSAKDFGALGDNTADDTAAITALGISGIYRKHFPDGNYKLASNYAWPFEEALVTAAGTVKFGGTGKVDFVNQFPTQFGPVWSQHMISKTYGAEWSSYQNIFQIGSAARSTVSTVPVVGVFGMGIGDAAGAQTWGGNFVSYANNATATAIGVEINAGALVSGGSAYGIVVASAGSYAVANALQIQTNTLGARFLDGIRFGWTNTEGCLTRNGLYFEAYSGGSYNTLASFMAATNVKATGAEINLPSFAVSSTPAGTDITRIAVLASSGGGDAILYSDSYYSNANVTISGKGTGGVNLHGGGSAKFSVSGGGLGFYGTSPQGKPTITGSYSTNAGAILNNLIVALASLGLVSNATTG